jgi:undecaprenyl phosphate-alpha-L-ara4FN deformylase
MTARAGLKIDVCTREGMRLGVPRLLDALKRAKVRVSFFMAFGRDCSGWAIVRLLDPKFRAKMRKSNAASLYGWRTVFSGTLLPARLTGAGFPSLVKRIADEGHDVAIHGWNHRRWQDRVLRMKSEEVERELGAAVDACTKILGRPPVASGAPGWIVSATSLKVQDSFQLAFASDLRGGPPCRLRASGTTSSASATFATVQLPTTGPAIEELLSRGESSPAQLESALLDALKPRAATSSSVSAVSLAEVPVLPIHAEVEGGRYLDLFERVVARARDEVCVFAPLSQLAAALDPQKTPVRELALVELAGRADPVASSR